MSRLVHRPIIVTRRNDEPYSFSDDGFTHRIDTIVDQWEEAGKWWEGEMSHHIYRVVTPESYMYDIERVADDWFIYRIWD